MVSQRGGFVMGLVAGLLIGLALALAVALYITKAPVPFVNKVPPHAADQDSAEAERNRNWDPNASLAGKLPPRVGASASGVVESSASEPEGAPPPAAAPAAPAPVALPTPPAVQASAPVVKSKPARSPAAILGGEPVPAPAAQPTAPDAFVYFVQAGAYTRAEDAEQQRARLGLLGMTAKVTERQQAGRTVYRVRVGPFPNRDEVEGLQSRLQEQGIEAQLVRVERP
ncbi:MAG: SPOR domain-containing protein [Burkholderiales bacterium]|nr:SPOR domain-containing protein [Burkholderiales bacterium]